MTLRALVTRPEEDAAPLAAALAERGIDVTLEPLLAIRPLPDAPIDLAGVQALLFTSANGVRSFVELAGGRDLAGWRELPVFAVGNATAAAAHSAGFARVESAAGDVNALAKLVAERLDPKAGALFHAAGSAVAGDLAGLLEQAGFMLRREMLYEARPADQLSAATVTNLGNGWFDLVLFFSPRTAATFVALARAAGGGVVTGCGKAAALCLSPAVAAAAGVASAARPGRPRAGGAGGERGERKRSSSGASRISRCSGAGDRAAVAAALAPWRHRRDRGGHGRRRRARHQHPVELVARTGSGAGAASERSGEGPRGHGERRFHHAGRCRNADRQGPGCQRSGTRTGDGGAGRVGRFGTRSDTADEAIGCTRTGSRDVARRRAAAGADDSRGRCGGTEREDRGARGEAGSTSDPAGGGRRRARGRCRGLERQTCDARNATGCAPAPAAERHGGRHGGDRQAEPGECGAARRHRRAEGAACRHRSGADGARPGCRWGRLRPGRWQSRRRLVDGASFCGRTDGAHRAGRQGSGAGRAGEDVDGATRGARRRRRPTLV